ncbi:MAG: GatB/YqeY domain-containing protein [Candidatus Kerfeldbacteria bacterium]|nr:GatB/YqeY domain-containing protein [Candidatus Kerfeldbacteria bacterium]
MTITERIDADLKQAMLKKEAKRLSVLRMLKSAIHNRAIADRVKELSDDQVAKVLKTESKKRKDSIEAYTTGGRRDLAQQESDEVDIIKEYLPAELDESAVQAIVDTVVGELGTGAAFGAVMKEVMARSAGQADGKLVSSLVKKKIGS